MVDAIHSLRNAVWFRRALFVALSAFVLFFRLLPLGSTAGSWPGPDLLLCLIFAWTMRRPDYLPVWLIAGVVLVEDFMLLRPPGLWTALVVVASEFIRSRVALTRELTFTVEWLLVAGLILTLVFAYRAVFAIAFVPQPGFGFAMIQAIWTILCYPAVVIVSRYGFDLRKPAKGETDAYGRPL